MVIITSFSIIPAETYGWLHAHIRLLSSRRGIHWRTGVPAAFFPFVYKCLEPVLSILERVPGVCERWSGMRCAPCCLPLNITPGALLHVLLTWTDYTCGPIGHMPRAPSTQRARDLYHIPYTLIFSLRTVNVKFINSPVGDSNIACPAGIIQGERGSVIHFAQGPAMS